MNFSKRLMRKFAAMKADVKNLEDITLFVDKFYGKVQSGIDGRNVSSPFAWNEW